MKERGNKKLHLLDKYLGIPLSYPAGLFRKFFSPAPAIKFGTSPKIAILCLGAIGDLLLLTGLFNGIRKLYPEAYIEVITSQGNKNIAPLLPDIDAVKSFNLSELFKIISYVRSQNYDIFFDSSQWARVGNLISNLSDAGITAGFLTKGQFRSFGYDYVVEHQNDIHEVDNFLNLGRVMWKDFQGYPHLRLPSLDIHIPEGKNIYLHMWCVGVKSYLREWPQEYWAQLIKIILSKGVTVNLTGSELDKKSTGEFIRKYGLSGKQVKNLAGKVSIAELAVLLTHSLGVVSINTGIMHLAALLNVKTVSLNGPTNISRWGPYGKKTISLKPQREDVGYLNLGFEYPRNPVPVMQDLPVFMVVEALEKLSIL